MSNIYTWTVTNLKNNSNNTYQASWTCFGTNGSQTASIFGVNVLTGQYSNSTTQQQVITEIETALTSNGVLNVQLQIDAKINDLVNATPVSNILPWAIS